MTLTLSTPMFPTSGTPLYSRRLDHASLSSAQAAMYDILNSFTGAATPAVMKSDIKAYDSLEQSLFHAGISAKWLSGSVEGSLTSKQSDSQSFVAIRFYQEYYTIAAETPSSPASVFDPSVTVDDCRRTMGPDNPPAYIASVTYGRQLVLLIQSSMSSSDLEAAVKAAIQSGPNGGSVDISAKDINTLHYSTVSVLALGGGSSYVPQLLTSDVASVLKNYHSYLQDGANFSKASPGVPISFTVRYLKDNTQAAVNVTAQSTQTTVDVSGKFDVSLGKKGTAYGRVDTGIVVHTGDIISIEPTGQVWSGVAFTGMNGPNGWYTWDKPNQAGFPNMHAHPFSLLYKVGDAPEPTYAGDGVANHVYDSSTGNLLLLINTNNYNNGDGHFTVTVRVQHRQCQ